MEAQLSGHRAWAYIMRAAERGQEVVQRHSVGQVDDCEVQTPLVTVAVEKVVLSHGQIEEMAGSDPRRIVIVVLGPRGRNLEKRRPVLRWDAAW